MKAMRIHEFGGPEVLLVEELEQPQPGPGQVLVRIKAAGVGPWDALIRSGHSVLPQPLPLTPGSDLAGTIEQLGAEVSGFAVGDEIYGVTNGHFTGAYAEFALADVSMIALKPRRLNFIEAASVPVVATTAWQMLFDRGHLQRGDSVLIHGAAGNVGAYAVQFARRAGARVIATAHRDDVEAVRALGADQVIDENVEHFENVVQYLDLVIDTVGGAMLERSFGVLRPGGALVSSVARPDLEKAAQHAIRAVFFLVEVGTPALAHIAGLLDSGAVRIHVGEILPLADAALAHEMLAGKPHKKGKIVLLVESL